NDIVSGEQRLSSMRRVVNLVGNRISGTGSNWSLVCQRLPSSTTHDPSSRRASRASILQTYWLWLLNENSETRPSSSSGAASLSPWITICPPPGSLWRNHSPELDSCS